VDRCYHYTITGFTFLQTLIVLLLSFLSSMFHFAPPDDPKPKAPLFMLRHSSTNIGKLKRA
ncbi:hypothetical protein KUCAC02_029371, partial [Chaenocephalus aceratus]